MMRALQWSGRSCSSWCACAISTDFRALFFSTEALGSSPSNDNLYSRISPLGAPGVSVAPVLDQWVEEGRTVERKYLTWIIRMLRQYGRFNQALEIAEWMNDRKNLDLSAGDVAIRMDLISKVSGLEQAEKYFNDLPTDIKGFQIYGALLNCYAHSKNIEKAESTMEKMKELGFVRTSLPYNIMLKLYSEVGEREKLDRLIEEMEVKGISCDKFTHSIHLNAYAAIPDIEAMENLLMKLENDPESTIDWNAYVVAANGFLKSGLKEKAQTALEKSEKLAHGKSKRTAFRIFLTLNAAMGNKAEVYRIWNTYKNLDAFRNSSYHCMINSLLKLDDIHGALKVWEEWESKKTLYDFRILTLFIRFYCKKGLMEKAEALVNSAVESGEEPSPYTWSCLATGYSENNQMDKAVEAMKKAILASRKKWKPNRVTFDVCLEYLKGKGEIEAAEELVNLCHKMCDLSVNAHKQLLSYVRNGECRLGVLDPMFDNDQDLAGWEDGDMESSYRVSAELLKR